MAVVEMESAYSKSNIFRKVKKFVLSPNETSDIVLMSATTSIDVSLEDDIDIYFCGEEVLLSVQSDINSADFSETTWYKWNKKQDFKPTITAMYVVNTSNTENRKALIFSI